MGGANNDSKLHGQVNIKVANDQSDLATKTTHLSTPSKNDGSTSPPSPGYAKYSPPADKTFEAYEQCQEERKLAVKNTEGVNNTEVPASSVPTVCPTISETLGTNHVREENDAKKKDKKAAAAKRKATNNSKAAASSGSTTTPAGSETPARGGVEQQQQPTFASMLAEVDMSFSGLSGEQRGAIGAAILMLVIAFFLGRLSRSVV